MKKFSTPFDRMNEHEIDAIGAVYKAVETIRRYSNDLLREEDQNVLDKIWRDTLAIRTRKTKTNDQRRQVHFPHLVAGGCTEPGEDGEHTRYAYFRFPDHPKHDWSEEAGQIADAFKMEVDRYVAEFGLERYSNGPGRPFGDRPVYRVQGKRLLITQRCGLDI